MEELINSAKKFLQERYSRPIHTVAAALETKDGKVFLGLNIDHFSGYVCAETSALATAMNAGETEFNNMVAVRREQDGTIGIANPCGKCRQIFHDYAPGIQMIVSEDGNQELHTIEELLPYSFKRQQQKIQNALHNKNAPEVIG